MWRCELRTNGTRQPARHAAIPRGQRRSGRSWSGPRRGYRTSLKSDRARGLGLRALVGVVACQPCGRHTVDERRPRPLSSLGMSTVDRVHERRKAAALARHYRDEEGFSIAEIARRLGRAPATIKAYLYDASQANKRPRHNPHADSSQPPTPSWAGVPQPRNAAARDRRHRCCEVRWESTAPD